MRADVLERLELDRLTRDDLLTRGAHDRERLLRGEPRQVADQVEERLAAEMGVVDEHDARLARQCLEHGRRPLLRQQRPLVEEAVERVAALVVEEAAEPEDACLVADAGCELVEQRGLAAPGGPEDGHDADAVVRERLLERRQLLLVARPFGLLGVLVLDPLHEPPCLHGIALPSCPHRCGLFERRVHQAGRGVVDPYLSKGRGLLDPDREVAIAAEADARRDPHAPVGLELGVQLVASGLHVERGRERGRGVVEARDYRIAGCLLDRPAVPLEHRSHLPPEAGHDGAQHVRADSFAQMRRVGEITDDDRLSHGRSVCPAR